MTEAKRFGPSDAVLAPTVKRIDRTPAETKQPRAFDQAEHVAAITSGNPPSAPLTYLRPSRERRMRRLLIWLGGVR